MNNMVIPLKSVIMMIGPTGVGKSKFIKDKLVPQLKNFVPEANIQILGSDDYRRQILGKDLDKIDIRMNYASEGAFRLMETKFDAVTTWPISADFVILDATFIGKDTREQFVEKAKKAQYYLIGIIFDFDDRQEYFRYITNTDHRWLIGKQLKKFRSQTLGEIHRNDFDYFYKIKSKEDEIILEKDVSYDLMKLARLPDFNSYFIIGDLHGCLKQFKELLNVAGFEIKDKINGRDDTLIILTGDIVDKGEEVSELIDFISLNLDRIKICIGGHDQFLIRYIDVLDNDNENDDKLKLGTYEKKFFDSPSKLSHDTLLKFKQIMERQSPFYIHDHFVVTHAPCDNIYIGKFDKESIRKQRNDSYPHRDDYNSDEDYFNALRQHYSFISNDSNINHPYHFFGHLALNRYSIIGNKVFLDTGCVYGNKLTGVFIGIDSRKLHFRMVQCEKEKKDPFIIDIENIINIEDLNFASKESFDSLEFEDKIDILQFAKNKINFISGTMSPCSSNKTYETLEDISEAFSYYNGKVEKVILEKKYMGSRANMYLFPKNIDKSYMVSRNGFIIHRADLNLKPLYEKMLKFFIEKNNEKILNSELVIIDGELLPWSALGKSLIESHFITVGKGAQGELSLLNETDFERHLEDLKKTYNDSGFKELRSANKKEDLINKIGESNYRQFSSFGNFRWISIKEQMDAINLYNKQLQIYGKEGELEFKPFAILKIVYREDQFKEEFFWNNSNENVFTMVSDDEYIVTKTDNKGLEEAKRWFNNIIKQNYEGVVIKPLIYKPKIAPYIKVRNPDYLTIIYGYDYCNDQKFNAMVENKNIKNKLKMSIKEFEIGKKMLEIPYHEINENNTKYLDICTQAIIEEKKEKELDPRL